jgi:nitrite reductase/ring-hydroxylating ferredoxin subunit
VARVEDLDGQGPFALSGEGVEVVAVRTPMGLKAYQGLCPHQGALLGEGELDGDTLVCRNHRWRFDTETGERVEPAGYRLCSSVRRRTWSSSAGIPSNKEAGIDRLVGATILGRRGAPFGDN